MRRLVTLVFVVLLLMSISGGIALADKPVQVDGNGVETAWVSNASCANIQSGTILDSANHPITVGYDQFGYNYQAHMFNGTYDSVDRNIDGTYWGQEGDFVNDRIVMKWSDEWLANVDCNNDHKLDRGLVNGSVGGVSLGWETNHIEGEYLDGAGVEQHYTYFAKIVWVGSGGSLWGVYDVIEEVYNDPAGGITGLGLKVGAPGFGLNDHWTTN